MDAICLAFGGNRFPCALDALDKLGLPISLHVGDVVVNGVVGGDSQVLLEMYSILH